MSGETPEQPAAPALFARWYRIESPNMTDADVAEMWRFATPADHEFWAELDRYRQALERLADPDTQVLDEGLSGGWYEELHVRTSLAKQALGQEVDCCTECMVSLGIEPDDE